MIHRTARNAVFLFKKKGFAVDLLKPRMLRSGSAASAALRENKWSSRWAPPLEPPPVSLLVIELDVRIRAQVHPELKAEVAVLRTHEVEVRFPVVQVARQRE